jgi:hypothetical protein
MGCMIRTILLLSLQVMVLPSDYVFKSGIETMNKKSLTEADIRTKFITSAIVGEGVMTRIEEFEPERAWWDHRTENEQAWPVSIDQIKAGNYNLDLKNPHISDIGPGDVDHLLPEYEKLLAQIAATRAELKAQLQEALMR